MIRAESTAALATTQRQEREIARLRGALGMLETAAETHAAYLWRASVALTKCAEYARADLAQSAPLDAVQRGIEAMETDHG